MAPRGYAVLQVNYRGSDGFGWKFLSAGFGQWGAAIGRT
jgi:dipeptidyl aminopeptidase/acylaminoacyl peptidase